MDRAGQRQETPARDHLDPAEAFLLRLIADESNPSYVAQLAGLYARCGRHDLAIACAQRAVERDSEDPRLLRLLGHTLEAGGKPDRARAAYLAAVDVGANPRHPEPWLGLARLERAEGRLSMAEQYARRALDLAPHSAEVYAELARVLLQAGRLERALTTLAGGLRRAPDDPDLLILQAAALAGR